MRIHEITESNFEKNFDIFLEEMLSDVNQDIVRFLVFNPLYRSMSGLKNSFGKLSILKNRISRDNPQIISDIIDFYLKEKGFRALRSNSIFCSGDRRFVEKFGETVYVIFPPKEFYFTWNRKIKDFFFGSLIDKSDFDMFTIDFERLVLSDNEKSLKFFKIINKYMGKFYSHSLEKYLNIENVSEYLGSLIEEKNLKKLLEIYEFLQEKHYESTLKNIFNILYHTIINVFGAEKVPEFMKINENSQYAFGFDNTNFEEAVKSGNEILITNDHFYYVKSSLFFFNKDVILNKLEL